MKSKQFLVTTIVLFLIVFSNYYSKAADEVPSIEVGAYIDSYIATDNDKNQDPTSYGRLFSYANPKKGQFSLNTAQISAKVKYGNIIRSNITFHLGDLHKTAWENVGSAFPYLQQANAGFRLCENFWIDGGYFLTHIGGESLLPKDNWLSSHSLVTFYEPFYQAGIKASYESEKITAQLHILNGNGIFEDNNENKTLGLFLSFTPSSSITISYAGVFGNEEPKGTITRTHILNNIVGQYNFSDNLIFKAQFDLGMKDIPKIENPTEDLNGKFIGASLTVHYLFTKQFSSTFRFAYSDNSDGIYNPVMKGMDFSLGAEYKPSDNSFVRLEGRMLQLDDKFKLFSDGKTPQSQRMELILNFGVWIN